jgi:copper chaperone CopZ
MTTHELRIEGMSCGHCAKAVEEALRAVPGVSQIAVTVGQARVDAAPTVTRDALIAAIAAADYRAS